eukprot:g16895.t1
MTIKDQLTEAMKAAMRAKDKERLGAIRLVLAEFKRIEVDERIEVADERALAVMDKMVKQRRDSEKQYVDAGREELAEKERFEISVIQEYLPQPLTDEEIAALIEEAISNTGAASMQDMGKVMGQLKPELQGRADMGALAASSRLPDLEIENEPGAMLFKQEFSGMAESPQQTSRIKDLIALGREQGYLTYAEVNDHLPEEISEPDQVEDIIQMINDMGIRVFETTPDADQLLMLEQEQATDTDDVAAAEAAAALAAVESEVHRTTDPVRMYMREMGTVELLTREGEIEIAKRIEDGIREMLAALAFWPENVDSVLDEYELVKKDERKLTDVMNGYLDPAEHVPSALEQATLAAERAEEAGEDEEEEDETPSGPDPEEAKERFGELKKAWTKAKKAI